jgi:hypothetical protein
MSFEDLLIHTVTVFNPTTIDSSGRYGDEELVFDAGTVMTGRVDLGASNEQTVDRDTSVTQATLFLLPTVVISSLSYWTWDGRKFRVSGEPKMLYDGVGEHHLEVASEEVRG